MSWGQIAMLYGQRNERDHNLSTTSSVSLTWVGQMNARCRRTAKKSTLSCCSLWHQLGDSVSAENGSRLNIMTVLFPFQLPFSVFGSLNAVDMFAANHGACLKSLFPFQLPFPVIGFLNAVHMFQPFTAPLTFISVSFSAALSCDWLSECSSHVCSQPRCVSQIYHHEWC